MMTRTGCRFARHLENITQLSVKGVEDAVESTRFDSNRTTRHTGCRFANRYSVSQIVICSDELFDSSRIASNGQHLLHCIVYNILTIGLRLFHALTTWKVNVVVFSYHATHFHSLLTCAPLDFRYVNARSDIRCDDSSTTVDESQRFECIGHVWFSCHHSLLLPQSLKNI